MSYLCYLCSSLSPVVCMRAHVLFMLFVFFFTSRCLYEGSCFIYVICVRLYLQLFVGGLMSYLCYLCSSLSPVVCMKAHVLFMLFVFVFISSCLYEGSCLIYVICVRLRIVVSRTYCVFVLFFFVLCTLCCQFLWIVHFWLPLRYSLTFIA
jgi:hypothetical protein